MNDDERVRLSFTSGGRVLGPVERERCPNHRRRWVLYRWTWPVGSTVEDGGWPSIVRGCGTCNDESDG